jgi:hypothetical protein
LECHELSILFNLGHVFEELLIKVGIKTNEGLKRMGAKYHGRINGD